MADLLDGPFTTTTIRNEDGSIDLIIRSRDGSQVHAHHFPQADRIDPDEIEPPPAEPEPDLESQIDGSNSNQDPSECNFWCEAGQYLEAAAKQVDTIYERIKNTEVTWEDAKAVGHGALDVAGLIPWIGEPADAINALWLAAEGDYWGAAFSALSVIPVVGDAIGKTLKLLRLGDLQSLIKAIETVMEWGGYEKVRKILDAFPVLQKEFDQLYGTALAKVEQLIAAHPERADLLARFGVLLNSARWNYIEDIYRGLPNDNIAVLGRYPEYKDIAERIGGRFFDIGDKWNHLGSDSARWIYNRNFLDEQIEAGRKFVLASPPHLAPPESWYFDEIQYLFSRGYVLSEDGIRMIPKGK